MTCRNQPAVSCSHQRRRMVQWVAAGVVLPTWAATAQAQMALSAAINVSGSFRALSQRMAKQYFLLAAGVDPKASQTQMNADAAEFKQALQALAAAPVSTPAIRTELELGQAQWLFFEAAMRRHPDTKGMEAVATTSERLLEVMDRLTSLYDAALREVLG